MYFLWADEKSFLAGMVIYMEKRGEQSHAVKSTYWFKGRNVLKNSKAQPYNSVI